MADINLDNLSVDELEKLKSGIDGMVEKKRNGELLALREKVDAIVDESPFSLEEILEARSLKKPVAPKYRNPADESQTWTGRGRKPRWVVDYLETGQPIESVAI